MTNTKMVVKIREQLITMLNDIYIYKATICLVSSPGLSLMGRRRKKGGLETRLQFAIIKHT